MKSEFYLNSGETIVVDRGFMVSVANLLEHGAFEENTTDADTATEYANELYRVLFYQNGVNKYINDEFCNDAFKADVVIENNRKFIDEEIERFLKVILQAQAVMVSYKKMGYGDEVYMDSLCKAIDAADDAVAHYSNLACS